MTSSNPQPTTCKICGRKTETVCRACANPSPLNEAIARVQKAIEDFDPNLVTRPYLKEVLTAATERQALAREVEKLKQELALALIPTTVDAVEREEWRQERDTLLSEVSRLKEEVVRNQEEFIRRITRKRKGKK